MRLPPAALCCLLLLAVACGPEGLPAPGTPSLPAAPVGAPGASPTPDAGTPAPDAGSGSPQLSPEQQAADALVEAAGAGRDWANTGDAIAASAIAFAQTALGAAAPAGALPTGTLTQQAAGSTRFTHQPGPTDRLEVRFSDGGVSTYVFKTLEGRLDLPPADLLAARHALEFTVRSPEGLDLRLGSVRGSRGTSRVLSGRVPLEGRSGSVELREDETQTLYDTGTILRSTSARVRSLVVSAADARLEVQEQRDFKYARGSGEVSVSSTDRFSARFTEGTERWALEDGVIEQWGSPGLTRLYTGSGRVLHQGVEVGRVVEAERPVHDMTERSLFVQVGQARALLGRALVGR